MKKEMSKMDQNMKQMIIVISIAIVILIGGIYGCTSCKTVPAGYVGVKVYLLGGSKGVDSEKLGVGRWFIGVYEELYLFPTFKQNYVWTKSTSEGSKEDESITFQTSEGLSINADVGITYSVDPTKVDLVFQKYRRGIEEITDVFLRNRVRDTFNLVASRYEVESAYGKEKAKMLEEVNQLLKEELTKEGLLVERIYLIGDFRLPETVIAALNAKIQATQKAQQSENELREAEAEAKKTVASARAEAESIRLRQQTLTPLFVKMRWIEAWEKGGSKMPMVVGGSGNILNIQDVLKAGE